MRRLATGLTCAVLLLGTAAALSPTPTTDTAAIPRPLPAGPAAGAILRLPVEETAFGSAIREAPAKGVSRVLLLTVAKGESPTPADKAVLLQCGPPSGGHPKAADACKQLERVSADLNELHVSPDANCTKEYDPVTVYGAGLWDSSRLSYERTFGTRCELKAVTGAVFSF
jgi:hypothetical protein